MINGQKKLEEIIKEVISPRFKQNDFKKSGRNYYKQTNNFGFTFNVQSSQFNTEDEVRFTFNIGIFVPSAYILINRVAEIPKIPRTIHCLHPIRIGLLKDQIHNWYNIIESTNLSLLKEEVQEDLLKYVFPFYENFRSIDDVINTSIDSFNKRREIFNEIQLCTILISMGERNRGELLFLEYYNKHKENKKRLDFLMFHAKRLQINV